MTRVIAALMLLVRTRGAAMPETLCPHCEGPSDETATAILGLDDAASDLERMAARAPAPLAAAWRSAARDVRDTARELAERVARARPSYP
jgi:hypothetical protein